MMRVVLTLTLLAVVITASAQTVTDALRYSSSEIFGTARSLGVGGALGALGADFTVLGINPAGLGAYRSSEFVLSGLILNQTTTSELLEGGIPASEISNTRFNISNIGLVFASQPRNQSWKASNFALGYNRNADYNQSFNFNGRTLGSITDRWADNATGFFPEELNAFEEALAFGTGAIYDLDSNLVYETDYQLNPTASILRRQSVTRTGGNGEIVLAYGANYNEKLLFGLTLGIPIVSFEETKDYEEEDSINDDIPFFDALRFEERLRTSGNGFNVKLGLTYKATKALSIGGAFHSRTRYSLSDNFSTRLRYDFTIEDESLSFTEPQFGPQEGNFDYNFSSPWSVVGNVGYIISVKDKSSSDKPAKTRSRSSRARRGRAKAKSRTSESVDRKPIGFIVAHIQYTDFSAARFDFTGRGNGDAFQFQQDIVNRDIREAYSGSLNLRFGGEFMLDKIRLRAGISMAQSPFADDNTFLNTYSAGVGYRFRRAFIDFGYQFRQENILYTPYTTNVAPMSFVENNTNFNRFMITVGYKWL